MDTIRNKLLKHSIRYRLVIATTTLIVFTVFLCWFANRTMVSGYYQYSKTRLLGNTYDQINQIYNNQAIADFEKDTGNANKDITLEDIFKNLDTTELINEEISLTLEKLGANQNMSLYIFDIFSNYESGIHFLAPSYPRMTEKELQILKERVLKYYTDDSVDSKGKEILTSDDNYDVYKVYDMRVESNYIELFGKLDSGSTIYIRTNLESMQESVGIFNKFLAYVGVISIVIGSVCMFSISKTFSNPILQLADTAKKMSDLDFDVKYTVTTDDEIGILGSSINSLSRKLEATISELKTANNELQNDIEDKIKIDEMRKDFLSNVSHELKTPIALIQGYAEGLKENISDDIESREFYCEVIMDEAQKMNKMVKKLLSLNQIEFGNNQVNFERFDLIELVKSVLSSTNILFSQKEVVLEFDETEPLYVWADEYMIEEVVTNYISNALNHVKNENIIKVYFQKREDILRMCVFNTGDNIPEDEISNIWIKFYKVDKARTREYGGSGIGLSIVKAILNSHNKECGVNNYSNGVEFWFEIDMKI